MLIERRILFIMHAVRLEIRRIVRIVSNPEELGVISGREIKIRITNVLTHNFREDDGTHVRQEVFRRVRIFVNNEALWYSSPDG